MGNSNQESTLKLSLKLIAELEQGYGDRIAFSPGGDSWATIQFGQVHLWHELQLQQTMMLPGTAPGHFGFSPDGKLLLAGSFLIEVSTNRIVELDFSPDSFIAGLDPARRPSPERFEVGGAAWSPMGEELIVFARYRPPFGLEIEETYAGPEGRLLLLSRDNPAQVQILWEGSSLEQYSIIAINNNFVVAGHLALMVWERENYRQVAKLTQHRRGLRFLGFNTAGSRLVSASSDGMMVVWDTSRWTPSAVWSAHSDDARIAAFHPHLSLLATGGWDNQLKLWSLTPDPELVVALEFPDHVEGLAFDPSGRRLVLASRFQNEKLFVYELIIKD